MIGFVSVQFRCGIVVPKAARNTFFEDGLSTYSFCKETSNRQVYTRRGFLWISTFARRACTLISNLNLNFFSHFPYYSFVPISLLTVLAQALSDLWCWFFPVKLNKMMPLSSPTQKELYKLSTLLALFHFSLAIYQCN